MAPSENFLRELEVKAGRLFRKVVRDVSKVVDKLVPYGQKPIMVWAVFEILISAVFIWVFTRYLFAHTHVHTITLKLNQVGMILFTIVRLLNGCVGTFAAFKRSTHLMRRYLFLLIVTFGALCLQTRTIALTECMCKDLTQCDALRSFALDDFTNLFELSDGRIPQGDSPESSQVEKDMARQNDAEASARLNGLFSGKTFSSSLLNVASTFASLAERHIPMASMIWDAWKGEREELPTDDPPTGPHHARLLAAASKMVAIHRDDRPFSAIEEAWGQNTVPDLLAEEGVGKIKASREPTFAERVIQFNPRPFYLPTPLSIEYESLDMDGKTQSKVVSANCMMLQRPCKVADMHRCHDDSRGAGCPPFVATLLWRCHYEPSCGAVMFQGMQVMNVTGEFESNSWIACRMPYHLSPRIRNGEGEEEMGMTPSFTFEKKVASNLGPSYTRVGIDMTEKDHEQLKKEVVRETFAMVHSTEPRPGKKNAQMLIQAYENVCTCERPGCTISPEGFGWCYISPHKHEICRQRHVKLLMDDALHKHWTWDLCRQPVHMFLKAAGIPRSETPLSKCPEMCSAIGRPPPPGAQVVDTESLKKSEFTYGSGVCRKWNSDDKHPWCYVGFHTACDDRTANPLDKSMVDDTRHDEIIIYRSSVGCLLRDPAENRARFEARSRCLFGQMILQVFMTIQCCTVPIMFWSVKKFLKMSCGETQARHNSVWMPFEKGSDESQYSGSEYSEGYTEGSRTPPEEGGQSRSGRGSVDAPRGGRRADAEDSGSEEAPESAQRTRRPRAN